MKTTLVHTAVLAACFTLQGVASAQVQRPVSLPKVEGAWVRGSVPGQQGTGAFMKLTAREPMKLVGVTTPAAGIAELHEMKLDGDVMLMRAVPEVNLPAGRTVEFKSGGYHLMLMDLKQPLVAGSEVPLTLLLRDAKGLAHKLDLSVPVAIRAPAGAAGATGGHKN